LVRASPVEVRRIELLEGRSLCRIEAISTGSADDRGSQWLISAAFRLEISQQAIHIALTIAGSSRCARVIDVQRSGKPGVGG
jgi:hypothetical protein